MSHQLKEKAEFIDRNSNLVRNYGTNPIPALTDQDHNRMKISILQHHVDCHALQVQSWTRVHHTVKAYSIVAHV